MLYIAPIPLAQITTQKMTHANLSPLQQIIAVLPLLLLIICGCIIGYVVIHAEYKEGILQNSSITPDTVNEKMLYDILKETQAYYQNNRRQMTIIFICAIISCFVGLTVLMTSIFYFAGEAKTIGSLSGTIISFISGAFFWIYKQCNKQVEGYFNTLTYLQNIFIAMELIKDCPDDIKNEKICKIIDSLMEHHSK